MITTSSKWFFGLGLVSLVLAAAYGWGTGGDGLGPVSLGYKGGVGDHLGYGILISIAVLAVFLGIVSVATRDADADALAQLAGTDTPPAAAAPAAGAYWPVLGAFGVALVAIGLVISNLLFIGGLMLCAGVIVEWMVLAWSDRATGDPATNRALRDRIMNPFEVPLAGALGIGVLVVSLSRLLLTSSELGAVWVAVAFAVVILGLGALVATRPRINANVVAALLLVGALGTITAGVVAGARGERTFHSISEEHAEEGDAEDGDHTSDVPQPIIPGAGGIGEPSDEEAEG